MAAWKLERRWSKERGARSREDARRYLGEVTTRLNNEIPPVVAQAVHGFTKRAVTVMAYRPPPRRSVSIVTTWPVIGLRICICAISRPSVP